MIQGGQLKLEICPLEINIIAKGAVIHSKTKMLFDSVEYSSDLFNIYCQQIDLPSYGFRTLMSVLTLV